MEGFKDELSHLTLQHHFQPSMSDYLPYGKLNEGVQHVDVGVTVPLPETEVEGCSVHLASDDYMTR